VSNGSVAIIDYDMANLRSVQKAFEQVGHAARIIRRSEEIDSADKIVLPGVGAFADAVVTLRERDLAGADPAAYREGQAVPRHLPRAPDAL